MTVFCKKKEKSGKFFGEPTENAIIQAGVDNSIYKTELQKQFPRIAEIPFESSRKLMTTIHKTESGYRIITKGAPDVLLKKCNKDYNNGNVTSMSGYRIEQIKKVNQTMAERALRVLAVAYSDVPKISNGDAGAGAVSANVEDNLIFVRINWNDRSTQRRSKRSC